MPASGRPAGLVTPGISRHTQHHKYPETRDAKQEGFNPMPESPNILNADNQVTSACPCVVWSLGLGYRASEYEK